MSNIITVTRIFLALILFLIQPLSKEFYIIYLAAGISDVLDGYIARKTNTTSELGAKLDSLADFVMVVVLIILLHPFIDFAAILIGWIIVIALLRCIAVVIIWRKHGVLTMLHTYANKATGLLLFVSVFIINTSIFYWFTIVICIVATFAVLEEILINLSSKHLNLNKKSIL